MKDEEEEEGTAHNLAHVSLIAQAQHNIKHAMCIQFCVCIKAFPACVVPPLPMNFTKSHFVHLAGIRA